MSFTDEVKKELMTVVPLSKHCKIADTAGAVLISHGEDKPELWKIDIDKTDISDIKSLTDKLPSTKLEDSFLQRTCCKRSFLRGAFAAGGTINNPKGDYHFEIKCSSRFEAELICTLMQEFDIDGKISDRRGKYSVYLKDADKISDMLNVMEAHVSLMTFENERIYKSVRGNINRQCNCETANLRKTVNASQKQCEAIRIIEETVGLDSLNEQLREVAELRLVYPEKSLSELGELMEPKLGRSGVNHRMEKIIETAEGLKC